MSLIVTSAQQQEYGGINENNATRTMAGIENPSNYQNYFKSPLKIEKNSEIAVESVKIKRSPIYDIETETLFYLYWGKAQTVGGQAGQEQRVSMPIPVRPERGSYSITAFGDELEDRINEAYRSPEIFGTTAVARAFDSDGGNLGYTFLTTQKGDGGVGGNQRSALLATAATVGNGGWQSPRQLTHPAVVVDDFTVTNVGGDCVIARAAANGTLDEMECSLIFTGGLPLALVNGHFLTDVSGAPAGWRLGLSRAQMDYEIATAGTGDFAPHLDLGTLLPGLGRGPLEGNGHGWLDTNTHNGRNQQDFYDYMVEDNGTNINIYNCTYDNTDTQLVMSEVFYYHSGNPVFKTKLTSASFNASYDSVQFTTVGDEVTVQFLLTGTATEVEVVNSSITALRSRSFVPIGETRNALYPRVNIADLGEDLVIERYDSHYATTAAFTYPTYDATTRTLTTGDDFYSNSRVARGTATGGFDYVSSVVDRLDRPYSLSQAFECDTKDFYHVDQWLEEAVTDTNAYIGEIAANAGVAYHQVMIIGPVEKGSKDDYLQGKYATSDTSAQALINKTIGFGDLAILKEGSGIGYVTGAGTAAVTFTSVTGGTLRVHSCFVRVSNMTQTSYNGGKQSTSKILYHLPRFSNDGREHGDLYFAPGEKTYLKLHNTDAYNLNDIKVELVDINEKPLTDLEGNTIVVFHIRQV